jgi:cell division protein FtsN
MSVFDQDDPGFQITLDKGMIISILAAITIVCVLVFILGIVVGRNTRNPEEIASTETEYRPAPKNPVDTHYSESSTTLPSTKPGQSQNMKPQPARATATPKSTETTFAIQVSFVSKQSSADRIKKKLIRLGYSNAYISILEGETTGYRVRVGPYNTRGDATEIWRKLKRQGYPQAWIVEN